VARMASLDKMADLRRLLEGGSPAVAPRAGSALPPPAAITASAPSPSAPAAPNPQSPRAPIEEPTTFAKAVQNDDTLMALTKSFDAVPQSE